MRRALLLMLLLVLVGCSREPEPAGFAGLAGLGDTNAEAPFLQPGPGDSLSFPKDFGPHPQHRIEWWYLTANLQTPDGQSLGLQWTQFRQAIAPRPMDATPPAANNWPLQAAWMAHAAVSFDNQHYFSEKLARGDIGHAGARAEPFSVWLDDWQLQATGDPDRWRLQVAADQWSYDLTLEIRGEPVAHGNQGFSAKSATGEGSMYFSLVDIHIEGTVTLNGNTHRVSGKGWFDREWSSQFLKTGQQGWDWFALHLNSGDKLMAFQLREDDGAYRSGTWIPAQGKPVALKPEQLGMKPLAALTGYPCQWKITVPDHGVDLQLTAPPGDYALPLLGKPGLGVGQPYW